MSVNKGGQGGSTCVSLSLSIVIFFASSSVIHHHCGCLSSLGSSVIAATSHHHCLPVSIIIAAMSCHHCPPVSIVIAWPLLCVVVNAKGSRGWGGDMAVGQCYVGCPCTIDTAGTCRHHGWCVYMCQGWCDGHVGVVLSLQHVRQWSMSFGPWWWVVLGSPVPRLKKDWDWTGPRLPKTRNSQDHRRPQPQSGLQSLTISEI